MRTLIRFMNAVRQENIDQAVQLLRPHSAGDRRSIVVFTELLIPSSEKTIRSVIQSEYLNNKSASDEDIEEAAWLVLRTESFRLMYNTVIESSPLLLAIKQGSVDEVRSLLQQLPRGEAVKLIINIPDVKSAVLSIVNCAKSKFGEKLRDEIMRSYPLTDEQLTIIFLTGLSKHIKNVISVLTRCSVLLSCLVLAAAKDSPKIMTLLFEYITSNNIPDFFTRSKYTIGYMGHIIASDTVRETSCRYKTESLHRLAHSVCLWWSEWCRGHLSDSKIYKMR